MSDYETALLWAVVLLLVSVITGFAAVTNRRPIAFAAVLFVIGGVTLYYAYTLDLNADIAEDIPRAVYKLYAQILG
ncbi:MAG: hypothetical protein L3J37_02510 [Rhodobacteraceae bacterium]|nr:hypothetical protein [Paracoccaceae bacterium]